MSKRPHAPRKDNQRSPSPQSASDKENDPAERKSPLNSNITPTPGDADQPNKPWYKTLDGWKTFLEIVGIPFGIGYAVVTYCQWRDLKENFRNDQRPYVLSTNAEPAADSPLLIGKLQFWQLQTANYGKSPAINVRIKWSPLLREGCYGAWGQVFHRSHDRRWAAFHN